MINNIGRNSETILGIKVDSTHEQQLLRQIRQKLISKRKFYIVTPNPEIILLAQRDHELARIINEADFSIPDGVGIAIAHNYLEKKSPRKILFRVPVVLLQGICIGTMSILSKKWLHKDISIIKGRDLFMELIKLGNQLGFKIMLIGGERGVADKAKGELVKNYQKIKISTLSGPIIDSDGLPASINDTKINEQTIDEINKFRPDILFVGFGAPKQEKWIFKNFPNLNIGGAMTIGGTLDYVSGKVAMPPKIFDSFGLEWLWRLLTQRGRIKRIINATVLFPLALIKLKLSR